MSELESTAERLAEIPFRPGESPFKMKGLAFRGHLDYVERTVPGGVAAMRAGMFTPESRQFFEQTFLAASSYDVFPLVEASCVAAKLSRTSLGAFVDARSDLQARDDARGVYKFLLKLVTMEQIALWLPKLMGNYTGFGEASTALKGQRHVEAVVRRVPEPIAPWYARVSERYVASVLDVAGARGVRVEQRSIKREGAESGLPMAAITLDVTADR